MTAWAWLALALAGTAAGQLVFKRASVRDSWGGRLVAIMLFSIAPPASYFALRDLSLATVYVSTALVHVAVVIGSMIWLNERYTRMQWAGFGLIVTGIILFNLPAMA